MTKPNTKKELALLLKSRSKHIVKLWSDIIFKSTKYQKERAASKSVRIAGMASFLQAFTTDIEKRFANLCNDAIERLVFKDYLSASSADEIIRELTTLRTVISGVIEKAYKGNIQKIVAAKDIVLNEIDKNIIRFSSIYKRRDFTRLETIVQYGKKLISIHDLDKLCDLILKAAVIESNSDRASLMLLDKDGYLRIKSSIGIPKKIAAQSKQKIGKGIAGTVAKTKEPIIISEGFKITKKSKRSLRGLGLESAISVPLLSDHTVLGVLNLGKRYNRPFFDKDDAELLLILAHEAGAAISNCKLFDEVHELYKGSIVSLAAAIDARDHYTHGHSKKVANIAVSAAQKLNLPKDTIDKIKLASMLHD
ncbi:MAG: GAF domain-containing protein, partial [Candidatus Saelkia tenebricola]|nr:GAF domain-containing protein [Candidatus Saelkia tenebricola]